MFSLLNNWVAQTRDRELLHTDNLINMCGHSPINNMFMGEARIACKAEPSPNIADPECVSVINYSLDPDVNRVLAYPGALKRVKKAALDALFNKHCWPARSLFVILKFWNFDSKLGSTQAALHDTVATLCYAATINCGFAEMTDRRGGQLDFIGYAPPDQRIYAVQETFELAMDKLFKVHSDRGNSYQR